MKEEKKGGISTWDTAGRGAVLFNLDLDTVDQGHRAEEEVEDIYLAFY